MENDQHLNENERNEVPDVVSSSARGRKKFSGRLRLQRYALVCHEFNSNGLRIVKKHIRCIYFHCRLYI